mgnify:CR=1 FL=1
MRSLNEFNKNVLQNFASRQAYTNIKGHYIPIVLNTVNYEDTYSGDFTTRRAVIYTLNFTAKTYLFGQASQQKVVKTVQTDQYSDTDTINKARESRIIVVPSPTTADADDDFGFTTTIDFFEDSKKYNVSTDTDE